MTNPTVKAGEYRSAVGLRDIYLAEVLQDDAVAYVADTPFYLAPALEATSEPKTESKTQYADDQPYDPMTSEGETVIKFKITNIPVVILAKITGKIYDTTTGTMYDYGGEAPYFACMFRSKRSNGKYRYYVYLKGRFTMPGDEAASKSDSPDPKTPELTFTAVYTIHPFDLGGSITDTVKRLVGDDDDVNFSATGWFTSVRTPAAAAVSALALSTIVPAANAAAVVISVDVVLTFNNALALGEEADIQLVTAAGVAVACATTIDTARKVVTLNPTANMSAATVHLVTYQVKDIYGQVLSGVSKFTTA
jgi:phi13 family phage major tail protein